MVTFNASIPKHQKLIDNYKVSLFSMCLIIESHASNKFKWKIDPSII